MTEAPRDLIEEYKALLEQLSALREQAQLTGVALPREQPPESFEKFLETYTIAVQTKGKPIRVAFPQYKEAMDSALKTIEERFKLTYTPEIQSHAQGTNTNPIVYKDQYSITEHKDDGSKRRIPVRERSNTVDLEFYNDKAKVEEVLKREVAEATKPLREAMENHRKAAQRIYDYMVENSTPATLITDPRSITLAGHTVVAAAK
ncbi:MAG: hypothetical protein EBR02_00465 [Alphaproteobacteria bacterium]|nr:hypothetical protein [Alphaproteobacteria bacterium]